MKHFLIALVLLFLSIPVLAQHRGTEQRSGQQHAQRGTPQQHGGQVRGPQGSHNGSWEVRPPQGRSEQRRPEGRHSWSERGGYRGQHIREDHYRTRFGIGHYFRPYWYNGVFVYAGYQIILVDEWPGDWYGDDVYVVFETDGYYLYSHVHPGIGIRVIIAF